MVNRSTKAKEAGDNLQRFGVDINDATNGVFLPTQKGVSNSVYHPSLHTDSYYRKVTEYLRSATSRNDVVDILDNIAEELLDGSF